MVLQIPVASPSILHVLQRAPRFDRYLGRDRLRRDYRAMAQSLTILGRINPTFLFVTGANSLGPGGENRGLAMTTPIFEYLEDAEFWNGADILEESRVGRLCGRFGDVC